MTATTVKMFIDIFIGIWAFLLAYIWCAKIHIKPGQKVDAAEIWHRFPKFVIGYVLTFVILVVMCWPSAKVMGPAEKELAELKASAIPIETRIKATTDAPVLADLKKDLDGVKARQKELGEKTKEPKKFLSMAKSSSSQGDVERGLFFLLCFFTIGLVSNFKKLMEEGLGKLAAIYCISLFGFIIWVGLLSPPSILEESRCRSAVVALPTFFCISLTTLLQTLISRAREISYSSVCTLILPHVLKRKGVNMRGSRSYLQYRSPERPR